MVSAEIVLVGNGHGALAALAGLERAFGRIALVSDDPDLLASGHPRCPSLVEADAPLAVLAGSLVILTAAELKARPIFNIHYSLLPKYRGLHSLVWALLNDEPAIGLTVHRVDEGIDTGPILYQHAEMVRENDTSQDLMARLHAHVASEVGAVLRAWKDGSIDLHEQDHDAATWVARRNRDDCLINFAETNRQLALFFRALVEPYPLPALRCRRGRFEVTAHRQIHRLYRAPSGRVVNLADGEAYIKTAEGLLVAIELRAEDGTRHRAADILRLGERLG